MVVSYQERTYHGLQGPAAKPILSKGTMRWAQRQGLAARSANGWHPSRVLVEVPASGPTERQNVTVLDELASHEEGGDFGWGYNGHGTSYTAAAVLADALELDIEAIAFVGERPDETLADLREDFCAEVLTDLCDEWRLNRRAILRWAAAWFSQHDGTTLPAILADPQWAGE